MPDEICPSVRAFREIQFSQLLGRVCGHQRRLASPWDQSRVSALVWAWKTWRRVVMSEFDLGRRGASLRFRDHG
jgi:hypothetical protein